MIFTVTKKSEGYVRPADPTPAGSLKLYWIDRYPTHRGLVYSLHIYKHGGEEPAKVIRKALAKALVPYYPLASKIVHPEGREPWVECTGEGVWFVEATADCSLANANYLERPILILQKDLVPYVQLETSPADTFMMIQATCPSAATAACPSTVVASPF